MFSIVPVLDDLHELVSRPQPYFRNVSLMDDFRHNLGYSNEVKTIEDNQKQMTLAVNCDGFKPENIKVSIKDNFINIEGNLEEKQENSYLKRQFSRRFQLPETAIQDKTNVTLTQNGVLKITIPKKPKEIKGSDAVNIPIQFSK